MRVFPLKSKKVSKKNYFININFIKTKFQRPMLIKKKNALFLVTLILFQCVFFP
jgi:hypothetical protein